MAAKGGNARSGGTRSDLVFVPPANEAVLFQSFDRADTALTKSPWLTASAAACPIRSLNVAPLPNKPLTTPNVQAGISCEQLQGVQS